MRWIQHPHNSPPDLVVVLIVHERHVFTIKRESEPPISTNGQSVVAFKITMQWMKAPGSRQILRKVGYSLNHIQYCEPLSQLISMSGLNAFLAFGFKECFQSLMLEAHDHVLYVKCNATHYASQG
jgi:hypothetical protein